MWRFEQRTLYIFIQGQPHFGLPRGAKMSSTLNEPELIALHSNPHTTSEHTPEVEFFLIHLVCKTTNEKLLGNNSH